MADEKNTVEDHEGRPVRKADLRRERMAAPTTTGVRSSRRGSVADGLTPERLARVLRQIDDGEIRAYLELAEEMEERELHYASVLYTRKLAVSSLDLKVRPASDADADEELAAEVLKMAERAGGADLLEDIMDALGKGFSVHEVLWDTRSTPWRPRPEYVDPRWFRFRGPGLRELRLLDEADTMEGEELPPGRFLVHYSRRKSGHPIRSGLARLAAVAYMVKAFTLKDWLAFAEVFGMPLRIGKYPANLDETTEEGARDLQALIDAVANLGSDAAAVIPENMLIEFIQTQRAGGSGGEAVYKSLCEYMDKQVSKGVLGQTMTTDEGSSLSQSQTHNDVRHDYRNADARRLMKTVNHLVELYVNLNYGEPEAGYPVLYLDTSEPEDLTSLSKALVPLVDRGLPVPEAWVRAKFGIPDLDAEAGELALQPANKAAAPAEPADDVPDEEGDAEEVKRAKAARRRARVAFAATQKAAKADALDELADAALAALDTGAFLGPIRELAQESRDYADFRVRLPEVLEEMDVEDVGQGLAAALFKARGLGDATDSVDP